VKVKIFTRRNVAKAGLSSPPDFENKTTLIDNFLIY